MANDGKARRPSADKQPKRRRTAASGSGAAIVNTAQEAGKAAAKPDGAKSELKAEVKADALENLDHLDQVAGQYKNLDHRQSFNDIFAGLVQTDLSGHGANSDGTRAILAAAQARQNEEAIQANQVQANMQHLQHLQAAQQLQHVSLTAATAAAMAVAQAAGHNTGAQDPSNQLAQQAAKAAAEAAQTHKPRPAPLNFAANPSLAGMLKQQPAMFSPTTSGTPTMFSPTAMNMTNANQLQNAMSMILQQNGGGGTPTTPSAMNAFTPSLQAQMQFAQQQFAGQHQHVDEQDKKVNRLKKNREAAKQCRLKKKKYVKCLEERVKLLEERNEKLLEELEKARSGKMSEEEKIAQTSRIETEYKQDVGGALPDNPEPPTPMATTPGGTVASFNQKIAAQVIS